MGLLSIFFPPKPEDPFKIAEKKLEKATKDLESALKLMATHGVTFTTLKIDANGIDIKYAPVVKTLGAKFNLKVTQKEEAKKDDQKKSEAK